MDELKVIVKVSDLLDALKKNFEAHKEEYVVARKVYYETVADKLRELLANAEKELTPSSGFYINLNPPVDNTKMYEKYIGFLSMSQTDEIEISVEEYENFVKDEWNWATNAKVSNSFYSTQRK